MGICAHPPVAARSQRGDLRSQPSCSTEQLLWFVAAHPLFEQPPVLGIVTRPVDGDLMGAPKSFDLLAVDLPRTGPAFRGPQDDERPLRQSRPLPVGTGLPRPPLVALVMVDHLTRTPAHPLLL